MHKLIAKKSKKGVFQKPSNKDQNKTFSHQENLISQKKSCVCDGGCPSCIKIFQPNFRVSNSEDLQEKEADMISEKIARGSKVSKLLNETNHLNLKMRNKSLNHNSNRLSPDQNNIFFFKGNVSTRLSKSVF